MQRSQLNQPKRKHIIVLAPTTTTPTSQLLILTGKLAASFGTTQQSIVTKYIMAAKVMIGQISMEQLPQSCDQANEGLKLTLKEEKHKQDMKAMFQGMNQQFIQIIPRSPAYE